MFLKKNYNIVWTECGSSAELMRLTDQFKPLPQDLIVHAKALLTIPKLIKDKTEMFKQTGALHYAFVFNSKLEPVTYAYDIGRHNAFDKVIGGLLLGEQTWEDKILYLTGRISSDISLKCLRVGIPIIISKGAPLESAIELANRYNLCMIGFLRGKRFNVYSNPNAIQIN